MKSWARRPAIVLLATIGLLAMPARPAAATTLIKTAFDVTVTLDGGLGYPLWTLDVQTPPSACLPLPDGDLVGPTNCHLVFDHQRTFHGEDFACVDQSAHVDKPNKVTTPHFGACSITLDGTVTGHCGLAGGQFTLTYTDSLGLTYVGGAHFTVVGVSVYITGHVSKPGSPHVGKITGVATAFPTVPDDTLSGSCLDKTEDTFTVVGTTRVVISTDPV